MVMPVIAKQKVLCGANPAGDGEKNVDGLDDAMMSGMHALMTLDISKDIASSGVNTTGDNTPAGIMEPLTGPHSPFAPAPPSAPPKGAVPYVNNKAAGAKALAVQADLAAKLAHSRSIAMTKRYEANPTEQSHIDAWLAQLDADASRTHADAAIMAADSAEEWAITADPMHPDAAKAGVDNALEEAAAETTAAKTLGADRPPVDPTRNSKTLQLGATTVTISGGTPEQQARTIDVMQQMYDKDPGFQSAIDSKASTGEAVRIEDFRGTAGGLGVINGHTIAVDGPSSTDKHWYANAIAHELGHNIGMNHTPDHFAFAETAASTVV